jgi:molybdopterin converting factor small subunit
MITMTLASPLFDLIPPRERQRPAAPRSVALCASSWPQATGEIRNRFPELAERVLTESGEMASGFVLVVNNSVVARSQRVEVSEGDQVYLLAQIAGGR